MCKLPSCFYMQMTPIYLCDKDIKVFELKTALVMKQLEGWLLDNELVNAAKTCAMLFHSSEQKYVDKPSIMYHTVTTYSPNIKFLGITLTEILKWNAHIDILHKSLNRLYFMIKSWRGNKSPFRILYYAYFQSHMKYSITFWFRDSYSKKVFCLQKKVVHLIFGVKGYASCGNNFKAHKTVRVASIYILGVLCFIKK